MHRTNHISEQSLVATLCTLVAVVWVLVPANSSGQITGIDDIEQTHRILADTLEEPPTIVDTGQGRSITIHPALTAGLWLEFVEISE